MKPSQKSPEIESFISSTFGVDRKATITADKCTSCGGDATEFRDALSRKEYSISGLCQKCQDSVFGGGEDE